jgi:hypothetical protein
VACGGNDVDPRVIPGGGVGDGEIDGEINVHVIDDNDNPIAGATVNVGGTEQETDENGLAVFGGVSGRQNVAVLASGFRSAMWVGVNGANVTIPLGTDNVASIEQATLSGSIPGWDTIQPLAAGHAKAALVTYSQTDDLGGDANNLATPNMGNICGLIGTVCNWQLTSRAGNVTVIAAIVDIDPMGPGQDDDVVTIMGWAVRAEPLTVEDGVNQQGIELAIVEAGNLQEVTIDYGSPPAGLPETAAVIGIELGSDEVVQVPALPAGTDTVLVPKPTVFNATATYRLTAIAQTTSGDLGAQSIVLRRGNTGTDLAAGEWLTSPTGVSATETSVAFEPVAGATLHTVSYRDDLEAEILNIAIFDNSTEVVIPDLVAPTGAVTARVGAIGADIDVNNFSLDEDSDAIFALAAEPTDVE